MAGDVLLGVVLGAHGLKGAVKVKTFTETPERLGAYGPLHLKHGRTLVIAHLQAVKPDEASVRFDGINERNAAEALSGEELYVSRTALPAAAPDEFYHADLIGLRAEDAEGRVLGTVSAIHNYGAGDVIVIAREDGDTLMLPFTRDFAPIIDLEDHRVVIAAAEEVDAEKDGAVE